MRLNRRYKSFILTTISSVVFLFFGFHECYAQALQVKRFVQDKSDLSAQVKPRRDLNGDLCALIKVEIASPKAEFDGNIVEPAPEYKMGRYWVYMTGKEPEARYLEIWTPGYLTLTLDFSKYPAIGSLKSGSTYLLTIEMPGADPNVIMGDSGQLVEATAQQQPVKPQGMRELYANFTTPKNLHLACECEGAYFYFSENAWRNLSDIERIQFEKKGIVVIGNGENFILDLFDSGKNELTWDEAMNLYRNRLPTKKQAQVMSDNYVAINYLIKAFNGDENPKWNYWTQTEYGIYNAWYINMFSGCILENLKTSVNRVRAVSDTPKKASIHTETQQPTSSQQLAQAQRRNEPQTIVSEKEPIFYDVERMPIFPGGDAALYKFLSDNFIYPSQAAEEGVSGTVTVRFVVTKSGEVDQVTVLKGKHPALDKEAIRIVEKLPRFIPGTQNGNVVNVWYTLPINFRLQK